MGRPTVTIASSVFEPLAKAEAAALGVTGLPLATVPHPVASRAPEEVRLWGKELAPRLLEALSAQR